jgi:hypothetical protein
MLSMFAKGDFTKAVKPGANAAAAAAANQRPANANGHVPAPLFQRSSQIPAQGSSQAPALRAAASVSPARANPTAAKAIAVAANRAKLFENPPTVGQYLYHLSTDMRNFTRAEIAGSVVGATPAEIQRLARLAAKLRGRYLAQALDLADTERGPVGEAEMRHLERARFMYEEVDRALDSLRHAIETGDLALEGLKRD